MKFHLATFLLICMECLFNSGWAVPIDCKENEEYQECGSGCPLTCQNYREPLFCTAQCKTGCFCRPGYVKGPDNKCIRPSQCPIGPCKDGEVASTCINPCNNCIQKGKCYFEYCIKGCDCRPGYYRNSTGTCVIAEKCESETHLCPPDEHYVPCVNPCNDCWSKGDCPHSYCEPGCDCNKGYFRDDYGTCVPQSQCDNHGCGENEIFTDCVSMCNDCDHRGHCDHYECHYGCDCKSGYFRNHEGHCISGRECDPAICGEYEEYNECGTSCPLHCSNLTALSSTSCTNNCVKGCFCTADYVRGPNGNCILKRDCCGENELYMDCGPSCEASCDARHHNPAHCPACHKGCFCQPGYVRGPNGKCILLASCPPTCGDNEEFQDCGSACPANCSNPNPYCPKSCVRGCFCKSGFLRNSDNTCVLPEACPAVCGEYEEFSQCTSLCPPTCSDRKPTCTLNCKPGCKCIDGYIRDSDGKCILPSQCPLVCLENETYKLCGPSCPISCNNIGKLISCKLHCNRGCFCNDGYVRGPNKSCIKPEFCPMRCGKHEELQECGTACQPTCANYSNPAHCATSCVKGCFCKRGYVRNANGKCILRRTCPPECNDNEVLTCSSKNCEVSCDDDVGSLSQICLEPCTNGCYCRKGFVRSPAGKCVQRNNCPRVIGFDGRNAGDIKDENDTVSLSPNPGKTKSSITTTSKMDLLTELDKTLPIVGISLPIIGTLLDEMVSTPVNTVNSVSSIREKKETTQVTGTTISIPKPLGNPTMTTLTKSSPNLLENPPKTVTTKISLKTSENPIIAMATKSPIKQEKNQPIVMTTKLEQNFSEKTTMTLVTKSSLKLLENPTEIASTKSPLKSTENLIIAPTTESPLKSSKNPKIAMTTKSLKKTSENPIISMATKSPIKTAENPTMVTNFQRNFSENLMLDMATDSQLNSTIKPMVSQTIIQTSISSKSTDIETGKSSKPRIETSTSPINVDNKTSNNPMPTLFTMNSSTA